MIWINADEARQMKGLDKMAKTVPIEAIERVIDDLQTEYERRMENFWKDEISNEFDLAYAEGLAYAIERLKELIE